MKTDKNRRNLVIWLTNILMATAVVTIVWFLVFVTQGWMLNSDGETQQAGLVQFASVPTGATIEVGDKTLSERSNSKTLLLPGGYEFKMWREGYETWFKKANVREGEILWLNYARLVPKDRKIENFLSIKNLKTVELTPNRQRALVISEDENQLPKFFIIDLRSDEPKINELNINLELIGAKKTDQGVDYFTVKGISGSIEIVKISSSNSRALLKIKTNEAIKWARIDLDDVSNSLNITDIFHLDFSKIISASDDMSKFIVQSGQDLHMVDLSARTISEILLSEIVDFSTFGNDVVGFVKKKGSAFEVGVWKTGEKETQKIAIIEGEIQPKISMARYYNENYIHITTGNKLEIYKGKSWYGGESPKKIHTADLSFSIENIKTNLEGRMVLASSGQKVFVRDLERKEEHNLEFNSLKNSNPFMIDNFIFYDFKDGKLLMKDYDGSNEHILTGADNNFPAFLSSNGKYIFGFMKNQDGLYQIFRLTMIL